MSTPAGDGEANASPSPRELDPEEIPPLTGWLSPALALVCTVLLIGVLATVLLQVVMRYFLNSPLTWTDEATRLQLVWLTFTGAVLAYRLGKDIAVDALEQFATRRGWTWVARGASAVVQLTVLLVAVAFAVAGWQLTVQTMDRETPALGIPVATFYAAVPTAGVLLLVSIAERVPAWNPRSRKGLER
ncbi:TRAP transporter small permease [Pseudonocardia sichuanensis]